jgi:hypothetical protein
VLEDQGPFQDRIYEVGKVRPLLIQDIKSRFEGAGFKVGDVFACGFDAGRGRVDVLVQLQRSARDETPQCPKQARTVSLYMSHSHSWRGIKESTV